MVNRTPRAGATASAARHIAAPAGDAEDRMIATTFVPGATSLRTSSNLPPMEVSAGVNPVMLPSGCAKLATKPLTTGSLTCTYTIGMLRVSCCIPIVFVQVSDPVVSGFVASLAHPDGNITGFTPAETSMGGKLLEVLKEVAPGTNVVAIILSSASPAGAAIWRAAEAVAPALGVRLTMSQVRDGTEIERAVQDFAQQSNGGLVVLADPVTNLHRKLIISLAVQHRLPAVYSYRYFVADGGLISYGIDPADPYRQAASYIHRIFMGEKPADLPVQQPTKFELVINLKTAKTIGLTVPPMLLGRADEVIE